jgi:hypothetical protein
MKYGFCKNIDMPEPIYRHHFERLFSTTKDNCGQLLLFVSIDRSMKIQFGTSNWIRIFVIWGIHGVQTSSQLKIPCSNCTVKPSNCTWSLLRKFSYRIVNIRIFNDFNFLVWWQWSQAKVDGFPAQEEFLNDMLTFRIQTWRIFRATKKHYQSLARNFAWNNFHFLTLNQPSQAQYMIFNQKPRRVTNYDQSLRWPFFNPKLTTISKSCKKCFEAIN